jgi:hypothetical protein
MGIIDQHLLSMGIRWRGNDELDEREHVSGLVARRAAPV